MNRYKYIHDLYFDSDGDFVLNSDTDDLETTFNHQYRGLIQKIVTNISSQKGEWRLQPLLGVGISDFLGKPNTARLGVAIQNRIYSELLRAGVVNPQEVQVTVFPVNEYSLGIVILIQPKTEATKIYLTFSYNLRENRIVPRNL